MWNLNVHYHINNSLPLVPKLSQLTPAHTFPRYFIPLGFHTGSQDSAVSTVTCKRMASKPTQPPIQWAPGFPQGWSSWSKVLTIHNLLVPGCEWAGAILLLPLCTCIGRSCSDLEPLNFHTKTLYGFPCTGQMRLPAHPSSCDHRNYI